MRIEPGPAGDWRVRGQRYRLVGEVCDHCGRKIFPPKDICPECGGYVEPPSSPGYTDEFRRKQDFEEFLRPRG